MPVQIINSPDGKLRHRSPHVFHQIIDKSAVPAPQINYAGIGMYVPFYAEKGEDGKVKTFGGPNGLSGLLDHYGKADAKRYGLPYSAAVMHALKGGVVIAQSLKSPSARHAAFIVNMKVKVSRLPQTVGFVLPDNMPDPSGTTVNQVPTLKFVSKTIQTTDGQTVTITKNVPTVMAVMGSNGEVTNFDQLPDVTNQFMATSDGTNPLIGTTPPGYVDLTYIPESNPSYDIWKQQNATLQNKWNSYIRLWRPVNIIPLEVSFEPVDIPALISNLKAESNDPTFNLQGVTSWEALETIVSRYASPVSNTAESVKAAISDLMNNPAKYNAYTTSGADDNAVIFEAPILWGYVSGRGLYGNRYKIDFSSTKSTVEGRPIMQCRLIDTKTGVVIKGSEKNVSLSNDFINGIPLLLDSAYSPDYFPEGGFKIATASLDTMDDLGDVIQSALKTTFKFTQEVDPNTHKTTDDMDAFFGSLGANGIITDPTGKNKSLGVAAELFKNQAMTLIHQFDESDDSNYHRLSNFDVTKVANRLGFVKGGGLLTYGFVGGDEGELKFMKEFDWDFSFSDSYKGGSLAKKYASDPEFQEYKRMWGDEKIVSTMFRQAFEGKFSNAITSLFANEADYVIDMGYPREVQQAMYMFGTQTRDDIQMLFNTALTCQSVAESISYKTANNYEGRNCYYFPGNFLWVDPDSSRQVRVPQTFTLIPVLYDHYVRGFSQSIAGVTRGMVNMVKASTGRGYGTCTLDENDQLYSVGLNILNTYTDDVLYLDSQLANYNLDEVSSLNEFHNNSIINRMLKLLYTKLQVYKHMISSPETAKKVQEIINRELAPFTSKVAKFSYSCNFANAYEKAIGELTHYINVEFYNTTKYHKIVITALPISN